MSCTPLAPREEPSRGATGVHCFPNARREHAMELTVVKNATCTFCGCVCDDIELHSDGERITHTKAACVLGVSWFKNHTAERLYPDALIDGKEATVDEAVAGGAAYPFQAHPPLVCRPSHRHRGAPRASGG